MPYLSLVPFLLGLAAVPDPLLAARACAPAADAAQPKPDDEATRSATARTHYSERRYVEAARMYEQLWRDTQAPKYRFNAGMARSAAEHDAAAIVHWQAYLNTAPSVTPRERTMLATEISAAKLRTRPVTLKVLGPLAPATLTLTAPDGAPQGPRDPLDLIPATTIDLSLEPGLWTATLARPGRPLATITFTAEPNAVISLGGDPPPTLDPPVTDPPPVTEPTPAPPSPASLTLTLGPRSALAQGIDVRFTGPADIPPTDVKSPEHTLQLPSGAWKLHLQARDHDPRTADLQLGPGELKRLDLTLRPDRQARTRLGLGLGLGVTGFAFLTAGTFVAANNANRDLACDTQASCKASTDGVLGRSTGFALIGTGLGTAAVALTAGLTRKDRALMVETGVGGVLLAGSLAWYLTEVTHTTALDHRGREHGAATLLGIGGGMFGSAVVSLIVRRITRNKPTPVTLAPSFRGLSLAARF